MHHRTLSFDSRQGNYNSQVPGNDGNMGVNGPATLEANMQIGGSMVIGGGGVSVPNSGNQFIRGDLYAAGNASGPNGLPVGRDAFVAGTINGFNINNDLFITDVAGNNAARVGGDVSALAIPPVLPCACADNQKIDIAGLVAFGTTANDNSAVAHMWRSLANPDAPL